MAKFIPHEHSLLMKKMYLSQQNSDETTSYIENAGHFVNKMFHSTKCENFP